MKREEAWHHGNHTASTLVKEPDFRVVLVALKPGGRVAEHRACGPITIQALKGQMRVHLPNQTVDLPAGHLLALGRQIAHDLEAIEESAFLLTMAWPEEHRAAT